MKVHQFSFTNCQLATLFPSVRKKKDAYTHFMTNFTPSSTTKDFSNFCNILSYSIIAPVKKKNKLLQQLLVTSLSDRKPVNDPLNGVGESKGSDERQSSAGSGSGAPSPMDLSPPDFNAYNLFHSIITEWRPSDRQFPSNPPSAKKQRTSRAPIHPLKRSRHASSSLLNPHKRSKTKQSG